MFTGIFPRFTRRPTFPPFFSAGTSAGGPYTRQRHFIFHLSSFIIPRPSASRGKKGGGFRAAACKNRKGRYISFIM